MATAVSVEPTSEAEEIAALIARSRAAQAQIANYTQEQVDALIRGDGVGGGQARRRRR